MTKIPTKKENESIFEFLDRYCLEFYGVLAPNTESAIAYIDPINNTEEETLLED